MIAMNTPLHTSPDARLSAADALSSLTASREAVARRFVTPLWYKIVSFGCTVVMTMLIWALWGGLFDALTNLQIVLGSASASSRSDWRSRSYSSCGWNAAASTGSPNRRRPRRGFTAS